jgi:hypothetical protein
MVAEKWEIYLKPAVVCYISSWCEGVGSLRLNFADQKIQNSICKSVLLVFLSFVSFHFFAVVFVNIQELYQYLLLS